MESEQHCLKCRYSLEGLRARGVIVTCPECGHVQMLDTRKAWPWWLYAVLIFLPWIAVSLADVIRFPWLIIPAPFACTYIAAAAYPRFAPDEYQQRHHKRSTALVLWVLANLAGALIVAWIVLPRLMSL